MANGGDDNLERLAAAGVIVLPLPPAHEEEIRALTTDQVDTLLYIKERLDAADQAMSLEGPPAFTRWVAY